MRWILLGYEFHQDGSFSPLLVSRAVLPQIKSREDYVKFTGAQILAALTAAAKTEYLRTHFFDTATEKITFKKNGPNKSPLPTSASVTPRADARVAPAALLVGL